MSWRLTLAEEKLIALALEHTERTLPIDKIRSEMEDESLNYREIFELHHRFTVAVNRRKNSLSKKNDAKR